jgi:hydrogenase expression/formation protein HypC
MNKAMCLGIPGKVVEIISDDLQLAKIDIAGVKRVINISLLNDGEQQVKVDDWVLIHVGFAMSLIDEERAQEMIQALEKMEQLYQDEVEMLKTSEIG